MQGGSRGANESAKGDIGGFHLWGLNPESDYIEPPKELSPYQKLFMAILMDAIEMLKKPPTGPTGPRYVGLRKYHTRADKNVRIDPVADAWTWLLSDDEDWCLAFAVICEHFGWDHHWVRKKAIEAIEKARAQGPKAHRRNNVATDGKRRRKWA